MGLVSGCASTNAPAGDRAFDFGPIASRHTDVNGDARLKILGPLYERVKADNGMEMNAVRPFYSNAKDPAMNRSLDDYIWPLGGSRTVQDENQWRFLLFYGFNHTTNDPGQRYRTWLMPFYFQGRNASGETYRALFPVAGTIDDFLGRDSMSFVLFPLYYTSQLKDISNTTYLWPFISKTTSERGHIYRSRVFPFYGVNRQEGKFDKRFILWPFYTDVEYFYKNSKGKGHILFPLYGRLNLTSESTWWVLPPFFRFTRGEDGTIVHAPWPFFQRHVRKDVNKLYFWPLWGHIKLGHIERHFALWPLFWNIHERQHLADVHRRFFIPLFFHTVVTSRPAPGDETPPVVLARRHKFWPLYSYRRQGDTSLFRTIELWPFGYSASAERNWAPFWSLYTRSVSGDNVDNEVLWGVFRNNRRADEYRYVSLFPLFDYRRETRVDQTDRSWNILKGLIGYERKGSRKTIRLLYIIKF
jgi:hypothetical protein